MLLVKKYKIKFNILTLFYNNLDLFCKAKNCFGVIKKFCQKYYIFNVFYNLIIKGKRVKEGLD